MNTEQNQALLALYEIESCEPTPRKHQSNGSGCSVLHGTGEVSSENSA